MLFDRLFTFGCSFTKYSWMTWADILGMEAREYHNTGNQGSGNLQIFIKLIEADLMHAFRHGDTVAIMWSSIGREDRTLGWSEDPHMNNWLSVGNIWNQPVYPQSWVDQFADMHWYLRRDLALIAAATTMLQGRGIDLTMTSIVPIGDQELDDPVTVSPALLFDLHQATLTQLRPSMLTTLFDGDWQKSGPRPRTHNSPYGDQHPTPQEHLRFVRETWPQWQLSDRTIAAVDVAQSLLTW